MIARWRRWKQVALLHEATPGVLLVALAFVALVLNNSPLAWLYNSFLSTPLVVQIGALGIDKPLLLWINDGLMAIFFFLIGLEVKRELVEGRLSTWKDASLPVIAALGGMLLPALIYLAINNGDPVALRGWAIPTATDIAFALGILALLGSRVPIALKVFLLALAILDDLGAILIIALFYTESLSFFALGVGVVGASVLGYMNLRGVTRIAPYILVGIVMWVCVLKSGVHATLAGVVVALMVPLRTEDKEGHSPLKTLEVSLRPWVAFGIMPLFAFANAGVSLKGLAFADILAPVPFGIALGLFFGKQLGVFGFSWAAVKLGICRLPTGVGWRQMYGISLLAGIGFTMSLFLGTLAFADLEHAKAARIGVLLGSTLSAVMGYLVLRAVANLAEKAREPARAFGSKPLRERISG